MKGLFVCLNSFLFGIYVRFKLVYGLAEAASIHHLAPELIKRNAWVMRDMRGSYELPEVIEAFSCVLKVGSSLVKAPGD
jgi:hypothetical protein